jgi:hypothetical protein
VPRNASGSLTLPRIIADRNVPMHRALILVHKFGPLRCILAAGRDEAQIFNRPASGGAAGEGQAPFVPADASALLVVFDCADGSFDVPATSARHINQTGSIMSFFWDNSSALSVTAVGDLLLQRPFARSSCPATASAPASPSRWRTLDSISPSVSTFPPEQKLSSAKRLTAVLFEPPPCCSGDLLRSLSTVCEFVHFRKPSSDRPDLLSAVLGGL